MRKIWQTGLIAALLALLVPVVILTAAGAVHSARASGGTGRGLHQGHRRS